MIQSTLINLNLLHIGYGDNGEYWRSWYEDPEFEAECARLWDEAKPLYEQLHSFVRRKLLERYPEYAAEFPATGQIPAHILGELKMGPVNLSN